MTWDSDCGGDRRRSAWSPGDVGGGDPCPMAMRATPIYRQRVCGRFGAVTRRVASLARRDGYTRSPRAPARRTTAVARGAGSSAGRHRTRTDAPRPRTSIDHDTQIRGTHAARSQAPAAEEMKPGARLRTAQPTFRTGNEGSKAVTASRARRTRLHGYTQAIPVQL